MTLPPQPLPRRVLLWLAAWVFGIATSVVLISLWGRAMVTDTDTLASVGMEAATADVVVDRIEEVVSEAVAEAYGLDPSVASVLAERALAATSRQALEELVREVILAGAAPPGETAVVDLAAHLRPIVSEVVVVARAQGFPVPEGAAEPVLAAIDPVVLSTPGEQPLYGPSSRAGGALTFATTVGLVLMSGAGLVIVGSAPDAALALRGLSTRVATSAATFALMLRIGAWITDPRGGRAPLRAAAAEALAAKVWLPLVIAAAAAVAAVLWSLVRRRPDPRRAARPAERALSR